MLKIALTTLFTTCGLSAAFFFAGPKIFYSGFQPKWPIGSGVKVVPDPTNIWSWHFENVGYAYSGKVEIVIDQNGDSKADQFDSFLAVLLTDMQLVRGGSNFHCALVDADGTELWDLFPGKLAADARESSHRFVTPLAFPRGKRVFLSWAGPIRYKFSVHLIGRVVNL